MDTDLPSLAANSTRRSDFWRNLTASDYRHETTEEHTCGNLYVFFGKLPEKTLPSGRCKTEKFKDEQMMTEVIPPPH